MKKEQFEKEVKVKKEKFEKEVKKILRRESPEKVAKFLLYLGYEGQLWMVDAVNLGVKKLTNEYYMKDATEGLKYLKRIQNYHLIPGNIKNDFNNVIGWLEGVVVLNQKSKSTGRPSKLSDVELMQLHMLRKQFIGFFPEHSSNLTKGTIICQLGELLLGKPLPKLTDKQLAKVQTS